MNLDGLVAILIVIIILRFILSIMEPYIKGKKGERYVKSKLRKLPKDEYVTYNDVLIKGSYGMTQIDHVVLSTHGIFVIETKNYQGWISGGEYSDYWVKNMYGTKYKFRNPLMQNYAHIKTLSEKLDMPEEMFVPIVAFSSKSKLHIDSSKPVVYIKDILNLIKQYETECITPERLSILKGILEGVDNKSYKAKKEHVEQIRTKIKDNEDKVNSGICPRCGQTLVTRHGRNGSFIGCSGYPKCRYTSNFDNKIRKFERR